MPEQLKAILPHIQNVALALGVLFVAYLLTIPLRRRYASCDGVEPARRSGRQFLGALLSYPAFSVAVLVLSLPAIYWLYQPAARPISIRLGCSFWGLYAIVRLVEGLLGRGFRADWGGPARSAGSLAACCVWRSCWAWPSC